MNQIVIDFAREELHRFQNKANDNRKINFSLNTIFNEDSYLLDIEDTHGYIVASTARGILYGVYSFAKEFLGYDFSVLGKERISKLDTDKEKTYTPYLDRRGNIFEVINDTSYLIDQIDMNAKYGHNEMFFTFFLYDEVKHVIEMDLKKRGIEVTLGGHSLKWLLEPLIDLEKNESENLSFYKDEKLMLYVIDRIVEICKKSEVVKRISLWPQDIGIPLSKGQEFMQLYIDFNQRLKSRLVTEGLDVAVEFIVYNAGLNWEMISFYEGLTLYDNLDILYAFWGRDYSKDFVEPKALAALKHWIAVGNVTVLEYYSDFFMMSELYPPLNYRISRDVKMYKQLGVKGILNLVVPLLQSRTSAKYIDAYDYQKYHQTNNIAYSLSMWGQEEDIRSNLENIMTPLTRHNTELFPLRMVDIVLNEEYKKELYSILNALDSEGEYPKMLRTVIKEMLDE